jgi:hypothetical protein
VAITYGGTSANDAVELEGKYDLRFRKTGGLLGSGASYVRLTVGGFAAEQKGAENVFFDFDDIQNGSGFKLGLEYGVFNIGSDSRKKILKKGIENAKKECVIFHSINTGERVDAPIYQPNTAIQKCSGNNLWAWIAGDQKRQNLYWKEIAGKLYGIGEAEPNFIVGAIYRQGYQDFAWLDNAQLQAINDQSTFDALEELQSMDSGKPFSIKAYLGASLSSFGAKEDSDGGVVAYGKKVGVGLVSSIAYKSEYDFDDKVPICLPQGNYSQCQSFNLSAPENITNWVPGVSLNLKFPSVWVIPEFGISVKATYATETDQFGLQIPVYFTIADDALSGGFKYFSQEGRTKPDGTRKDESGIAFFVGTKFKLLDGR